MRLSVLLAGLVIAASCSVTTPTPSGTAIASWKASESKWSELAAAAAKVSGTDGAFEAVSTQGAKVALRFKTGLVEIGGKRYQMPLEATATVTDANGFAISGSFSDSPMHYAGMAEDVRALDLIAQLSSGRRSCAGTTYRNDWLRVRILGDGKAQLLPEPTSSGSTAPPVASP